MSATHPPKLNPTASAEFLSVLNKGLTTPWVSTGQSIRKNFEFADFAAAFGVMTAVAAEAERLNHHPEWINVYNTLSIRLTTHNSGGLTELDFQLAEKIEECARLARGQN